MTTTTTTTTTISSPTYPSLPAKLVLTSTKAYFSPSRTIAYLDSILDPENKILPLLAAHRDQVLFVLIPDFLTIYPSAQTLTARFPPSASSSSSGAAAASATAPATAPTAPATAPATARAPAPAPATTISNSSWPIALGAQNAFQSTTYGAYTGEVVAPALQELGCSVVELNHAERRRLLGETDESAAAKAAAVCALGMVPLVCVGEVDRPSDSAHGPLSRSVGLAIDQLTPQIEPVLRAVPLDAPVIFAYEPVWAIGAAEPAGVDYVGPVVQAIREIARRAVPGRTAEVKVVYGGSAGPGLWSGKANGGNGLGKWVDGLFLGRFAHHISGVRAVVEEVVESLSKS
ncbi:hypothetical protein A1O3_07350 [Capronia epimyces CBS 606.96]|uniref:Triosephosphate isomerase n=1 Tax=Capronia epimyces CBS 606.96 TaxID=1182542 RepID=W9XKK8_9EURO|nr:uncharacterized protein A1O3_07350 [Capronia epimyces CBS 606.96]EXJ81062.1 hypothetical protein A1O3_07350 [Capronia epimyces CBS 606.96]